MKYNLDLYLKSIQKVDAKLYHQLIDWYGGKQVVTSIQRDLQRMREEVGDLYEKQLKIWDKYGYYLATLDYNMFQGEILEVMQSRNSWTLGIKKSNLHDSLQKDGTFTLEEQVYYGFHLLKYPYIEIFMDQDDRVTIDIFRIFSSIQSKEMCDYVLECFQSFYRVCSRNSYFDQKFQNFLKKYQRKCQGDCIPNMSDFEEISLGESSTEILSERFLKEQIDMYIQYSTAVDLFMRTNIRLVEKYASPHESSSYSFDDLVQDGMLGMLKSIYRFDIRRGYRFSTYAWDGIKKYVFHSIANNSNMIRIPVYIQNLFMKKNRFEANFFRDYGRKPTISELAEMLDVSEKSLNHILARVDSVQCNFLSQIIIHNDGYDDDISLESIIDNQNVSLEEDYISSINLEEFLKFMDEKLSEEEKEILMKRYGDSRLTLEKIGEELGVTREAIRIREKKIIYKLTRTKKGKSFNPFE